jgi:hypothetical protein
VDIDGVRTFSNFEVIEIVDDSFPYPAILGIDWAFNNSIVVDLKKRHMTFERDGFRFIAPLDPYEGHDTQNPSNNKTTLTNWKTSTN